MRLFGTRLSFLFTIAALLTAALNCHAAIESWRTTSNAASALSTSPALTVKDEKFGTTFDYSTVLTTFSQQGFVSLRIVDIPPVLMNNAAGGVHYEVDISIVYFTDTANPNVPAATPLTATLKVTYNAAAGTTYKGLDYYTLPAGTGAFKTIVSVTDVRCVETPGVLKASILGLQLESSIVINRQYKFQPSAPFKVNSAINVGSSLVNATPATVTKQLALSWDPAAGAEEYDVEWATIDNGSDLIGTVNAMDPNNAAYNANIPVTQLDQLFQNNCSRVTVSGNAYNLSLMYDNDFLVVRIRGVQYDQNGNRLRGDWNYKCNKNSGTITGYHFWPLIWNDSYTNWQYSATFAEEGKKKEVVSYFDGTLRGRQTATINNADNVLIVQEDIYDQFGRKTASILPAPFKEASGTAPHLRHVSNFNLNNAGTPVAYKYTDITGAAGATDCEILPQPLSTTSGASSYYSNSPTNSFKTLTNYNKFIPDAGGYPIAVTQYTKDNTGRTKLAGGVGPAFQPGTGTATVPSRTSKYYYGKPEQWELDQMFGNDVGFAEHYTKNMVIDPNGQISLSYLNASGKTIATALAGPKPDNLDQLPNIVSNPNQSLSHIITNSQFTFNGTAKKITATTTYLASVPDPTAFLQLNIQELIDNYPGNGLCSNCYYEVTVKVTDDCGNIVNTTTMNIGSPTPNCAYTDPTPVKTIPVNLGHPGEYNISVEFAMNNDVINNYVDNFTAQSIINGYLQSQYNYIKQNYLASLDATSCYSDCKTCGALLNGVTAFQTNAQARFASFGIDVTSGTVQTDFLAWSSALYTTLSNTCTNAQATCDLAPCNDSQSAMLADVSPGGQWALFNDSYNALEPDINVLTNNFTKVFSPTALAANKLLSTDPASSVTLGDGSKLSVYDANFSIPMMVQNWNPAWANIFLQYHPEFCKLKFCQTNDKYYNWDERMKQFTLTNASYTESTPLLLLQQDPFFNTSLDPLAPGAAYLSSMTADLQSYSSNILGFTGILDHDNHPVVVKTLPQYVDYLLYCNQSETPTPAVGFDPWNNCSPTLACRSRMKEWQLYRDMYFQLKQKYYEKLRTATVCLGACPVGTPITVSLPGDCPSKGDFMLELWNDPANPACDNLSQMVRITYMGGKLTQAANVNIYYPVSISTYQKTVVINMIPFAVNFPVQKVIPFTAGQQSAFFCVPLGTDISSIHVSSASCPQGGLPAGQNYVSVSDNVVGRHPFTIQIYTGWFFGSHWTTYNVETDTSQTTITLKNNLGVPTTQATDVTVVLNYSTNHIIVPLATYQNPYVLTAVIPHGTSTISTKYVSYEPYKTAGPDSYIAAYYQSYTGPVSVTNASFYTDTKPIDSSPPEGGGPASCNPAYSTKASRFDSVDPALLKGNTSYGAGTTGMTNATNAAKAQILNFVTDACTQNADAWIAALQPGLTAMGATTTQISTLKSRLIEVCVAGGDAAHLSGASTSPVNTASGYNSFGGPIQALIGSTIYTAKLNPWLISSPYPYNWPLQQASRTINATNTSICARLDALKTKYTAATGQSYTIGGFFTYLVATYGANMTITQAQLQTLMDACSCYNVINGPDVTLPGFMDPTSKGWIDKSIYTTAKAALQPLFNNLLSVSDPNYQTIFTNYMNQQWGFNFRYSDYMKFETDYTANASAVLSNTTMYNTVPLDPSACFNSTLDAALANGTRDYFKYIEDAKRAFRVHYIATCSAAKAYVDLQAKSPIYQYTLYYYDQADNLVRTVPPEGVQLITNTTQLANIQNVRNGADGSACSGTYTGPTGDTPTATAFGAMETNFNGNLGGTIELWVYNPLGGPNQVIQKTPSGTYQFQVTTTNTTLNVEIFSGPMSGTFQKYNHYTFSLTGLPAIQEWTHIAIYSTNFVTAVPQVLVNGTLVPQTAGTGAGKPMPNNLSTLKFMHIYNGRMLPTNELQLNAINNCFVDLYTDNTWSRFNTPPAGSETTLNGTTTNQETAFAGIYPNHGMQTSFLYNAANNIVQQYSPDAGTNRLWYDLLGRVAVSQNDKQLALNSYSYTLYEPTLGRITEVGQKAITTVNIGNPGYITDVLRDSFNAAGTNTQITNTIYDGTTTSITGLSTVPIQSNLRKRVAISTYRDNTSSTGLQATFYSYDVDGSVKTLWQQISGLTGVKRLDYEYDLVSGKVNFLRYQDGAPDQFYYQYFYDAENRLTDAWSGTKAMVDQYSGSTLFYHDMKLDAHYYYYLHGPLARLELGDQYTKVQGIDYAYTLQGWLKGVNSTNLSSATDMDGDGTPVTGNPPATALNTKDALGYSLHYYGATDYTPIVGNNPFADASGAAGFTPLYNGNIAASAVNITFPNATSQQIPLLYVYGYDQLNRLTRQSAFNGLNVATNVWTPVSINDYKENISYDGNGNIKTYVRNGNYLVTNTTAVMDNLTYNYARDINGVLQNNRLTYIKDAVTGTLYNTDINTQASSNYKYDPIGNITNDGSTTFTWNVYGKLLTVGGTATITYAYNASQQRVSKKNGTVTTFYVRDAQGSPLAIYDNVGSTVNWKEQHLYGSSRVGIWLPNLSNIVTVGAGSTQWEISGLKQYELSNHLGNTLAAITDRRVQHINGSTVDYLLPDIVNAQDYYPFGMLQPGRTYALGSNYRYGFNGKENDNDIKKDDVGVYMPGVQQDYGMRIYDPRVGRFLSVDPLTQKYSDLTPYQFASNRPVDGTDLDGKEWENIKSKWIVYSKGVSALPIIRSDNGWGHLLKATYNLQEKTSQEDFNKLKNAYLTNPGIVHNPNNGYAQYYPLKKDPKNKTLSVGDHMYIDITGPFNDYVRFTEIKVTDNSFYIKAATLSGHTDAGFISFSGSYDPATGIVNFSIYNETTNNLGLDALNPRSVGRSAQRSQWELVLNNVGSFLKGVIKSKTLKTELSIQNAQKGDAVKVAKEDLQSGKRTEEFKEKQ